MRPAEFGFDGPWEARRRRAGRPDAAKERQLKMRTGPRHPKLGKAGFRFSLPLFERFFERRQIFRSTSAFAAEQLSAIRAKRSRKETVYLAGIGAAGTHNSGVALIAVTADGGPNLIC